MNTSKRNSLLCPNCRRLVSRSAPACPHCGLKTPGSLWNDNLFTRGDGDGAGILRLVLAVNIALFVVSLLIDLRHTAYSSNPLGFLSPSSNSLLVLGSTGAVPLFHFQRWWTLISAGYLHGGLLHLVFNMIALHQIGPLLIREFGASRTVVIYTLSSIGGYLISALFGVRFTIGASAAICGLLGAALYYGKSRGGVYGQAIYRQVGGWAIGIFIFGFIVPGINNWGHAGGMLVGALVAYWLGYRERARDSIGHKFFAMACVAGTAVALLWSLLNGLFFLLR